MWPNPQDTADLVTFTEEILIEKLDFLCCVVPALTNKVLFLIQQMFVVKLFQKWELSVKQNFQIPHLVVSWTIGSIFHFMLSDIFSLFSFHMYFKNSVLLTYFLWQKSLVWFLKRSLTTIPKYVLPSLLGADTTVLYTMFAIKHFI